MSYFQTRPDSLPPIVKNLIIINVLVWLAQVILDPKIGLTNYLGLFPFGTEYFKPYQIATHMFAHASYGMGGQIAIMHILFNMFGLWMFGRVLETYWGPKRFLLFYLLCGVGAAIAHLAVQYFTNGFSMAVGASGAIMGVLAAYAYLFPNTEMFIMFIPFPIKAKYLVSGLIAYDLIVGIGSVSGDNVARFAHVGGALTGFIIVLIWNKTNKRRFY